MAPELCTAASLGLLNRFPCQLSATVRLPPPSSNRLTRRSPCSQEIRFPFRSSVRPLLPRSLPYSAGPVKPEGSRNRLTPSPDFQRWTRLWGMSLKSRCPCSFTHTGPSAQACPIPSTSMTASGGTSASIRGSSRSIEPTVGGRSGPRSAATAGHPSGSRPLAAQMANRSAHLPHRGKLPASSVIAPPPSVNRHRTVLRQPRQRPR